MTNEFNLTLHLWFQLAQTILYGYNVISNRGGISYV